jgi:hypothetical protein
MAASSIFWGGDAQVELGLLVVSFKPQSVEHTEDIGGWALTLNGSRPVAEISGPAQIGKNIGTAVRIGDDTVLPRLAVAGRAAQTSALDTVAQNSGIEGPVLPETAKGSGFGNDFFHHEDHLSFVGGWYILSISIVDLLVTKAVGNGNGGSCSPVVL